MLAGLFLAAHRADAVEEIVHENVGLERAAGFGGDDEQRLAEIDRPLDRLDLCGIGAVQHVEARPTRLPPEGRAQHFRTEARAAHAQQDDVGEAALLYLLGKALQPINIGQLLLDDVQPAEPFVLVRPGPQRLVPGPKAPNAAVLAPGLHFRFERGLHLG